MPEPLQTVGELPEEEKKRIAETDKLSREVERQAQEWRAKSSYLTQGLISTTPTRIANTALAATLITLPPKLRLVIEQDILSV